jgi:hypothetical protein
MYKVDRVHLCNFLENFIGGKRYALVRLEIFGGIFNFVDGKHFLVAKYNKLDNKKSSW